MLDLIFCVPYMLSWSPNIFFVPLFSKRSCPLDFNWREIRKQLRSVTVLINVSVVLCVCVRILNNKKISIKQQEQQKNKKINILSFLLLIYIYNLEIIIYMNWYISVVKKCNRYLCLVFSFSVLRSIDGFFSFCSLKEEVKKRNVKTISIRVLLYIIIEINVAMFTYSTLCANIVRETR